MLYMGKEIDHEGGGAGCTLVQSTQFIWLSKCAHWGLWHCTLSGFLKKSGSSHEGQRPDGTRPRHHCACCPHQRGHSGRHALQHNTTYSHHLQQSQKLAWLYQTPKRMYMMKSMIQSTAFIKLIVMPRGLPRLQGDPRKTTINAYLGHKKLPCPDQKRF